MKLRYVREGDKIVVSKETYQGPLYERHEIHTVAKVDKFLVMTEGRMYFDKETGLRGPGVQHGPQLLARPLTGNLCERIAMQDVQDRVHLHLEFMLKLSKLDRVWTEEELGQLEELMEDLKIIE